MCAYCEDGKPLFQDYGMTKDGITGKAVSIRGNRIETAEYSMTAHGPSFHGEISDFEMDYCPKCGKGLTGQTTDVQSLREMDKE